MGHRSLTGSRNRHQREACPTDLPCPRGCRMLAYRFSRQRVNPREPRRRRAGSPRSGSRPPWESRPGSPLMQLDDLPADIQPQSQSLRGIVRSGLKEALEDLIACLDGDPMPRSQTVSSSVPGAGCESVTTIGSPGWLCLMALSRRLASTSPNRNGSIQAFSAAGASSVIRCRSLRFACC